MTKLPLEWASVIVADDSGDPKVPVCPHADSFRFSSPNPFRMNTCKSVAKQRTLTTFRMNTYEKTGGKGVLWLTKYPTRIFVLSDRRERRISSRNPAGQGTEATSRRTPATNPLWIGWNTQVSWNRALPARTLLPFRSFRGRILSRTMCVESSGPLWRIA